MVSHDIEESIYLADRIGVMTNGPVASVGRIVEVPLARPQDRQTLLQSPAYLTIKEGLLHLLAVVYAKAA